VILAIAVCSTEKLEVAAPPPGGGFEIAVDLVSNLFNLQVLIHSLILPLELGTTAVCWGRRSTYPASW
jgi:hypothetical protein